MILVNLDVSRITQMYEYLRLEYNTNMQTEGIIGFSRASPYIAQKASERYHYRLASYILFTGGVGKDSGSLVSLSYPKSVYQAGLARWVHDVPDQDIYVEKKASNGAENTRFSIDLIREKNLPYESLTLILHPVNLRRVFSTHLPIAEQEKQFFSNYALVGTDYSFDPANPIDQRDAVGEILRLERWPEKGWCKKQDDLPSSLVEYAEEIEEHLFPKSR